MTLVQRQGKIQGGGDRISVATAEGVHVATVVRLPGTLTRVFWADGSRTDYPTIVDALGAVDKREEQ